MKRWLVFHLAVLPLVGRNNYERMNSRLDRQIIIRGEKRRNATSSHKKGKLYPFYEGEQETVGQFFDR